MNDVVDLHKVSLKVKVLRSLWNLVWLFLFRPFGTKIFLPWRILVLKIFGADVKWDSGIYCSVRIWAPWNLKMGHKAWLGPHVICYNQAFVYIEDNVVVSQYSYLCTAGHKTTILNNKNEGLIVSPILLRKNSWIGTKAYIGMGVVVGECAIVGATASVYKDVAPYTIVGGNPARLLKETRLEEDETL